VDDSPRQDGFDKPRRVEFVQVVHPRALHPRANTRHVDDERRLDDHHRVTRRRVLCLAAKLIALGVVDGQFHPRFEVRPGLGPLAPERDRHRRGLPPIRAHLDLQQVRLAVLRVDRASVTDRDDWTANVHVTGHGWRAKNAVGLTGGR